LCEIELLKNSHKKSVYLSKQSVVVNDILNSNAHAKPQSRKDFYCFLGVLGVFARDLSACLVQHLLDYYNLSKQRQPNKRLQPNCYRPVFQAFLAGKVGV
jgi:hypothetical protein